MWWEVAIDGLWPSCAPKSLERSVVECGVAGAFTRRPNESGWLADEVIATGVLQQGATLHLPGEEPLPVMCDGDRGTAGLIELLRP